MNYAVIKKNDIANGPGVRVSLFVSGCRHHCRNCFNREAWDFSYGQPFTRDTIDAVSYTHLDVYKRQPLQDMEVSITITNSSIRRTSFVS